jgi:hypothetical protein
MFLFPFSKSRVDLPAARLSRACRGAVGCLLRRARSELRSVLEFYNRNPGASSTLLLGVKSFYYSMLSEEFLHRLAKSPGAVSMNNMDLVVTIKNCPINCFVQ